MALNTIDDLSVTPASNSDFLGQSTSGTQSVSTLDNMHRNFAAIMARFYSDLGGVMTVGGSANAITVTSNSTYQTLGTGLLIAFKAVSANTGATTLALDSLGAKAVRRQGDSALQANDIVANGVYLVRYDASYNTAAGAWVLLNPANNGYTAGGTDVALADGGTGTSLTDPDADRILFWDDSAGAMTWLAPGTNLTITGTTIDATAGGWTQVGGTTTTTSGTTISITSIPSGYRQLALRLNAVTPAASNTLTIALSTDNGGSYSSTVSIQGASGNSRYGIVLVEAAGDSIAKTIIPMTTTGSGGSFTTVSTLTSVTGVINALQLGFGGAAFAGGSVTLWGIK